MGKIGRIKSYAHAELLYGRTKRHPELGMKLDSPDRRMQRWGDTYRISIHGEIVAILHADNTMEFKAPDHYSPAFGSNFSKVFPLDLRNTGRQQFNAIRDEDVGRTYAARGSKKVGVQLVDGLRFDMRTWKPIDPPIPEGRPVNKAAEARFRKALVAYRKLWKVTARFGRIAKVIGEVRDSGGSERWFRDAMESCTPYRRAEFIYGVIVGQKIDDDTILGMAGCADLKFIYNIQGPLLRRPDAVRAMSVNERHGLIFDQAYAHHRDEVRALAGVFDRG